MIKSSSKIFFLNNKMQRINIDFFNENDYPKQLVMKSTSSTEILRNTEDYIVTVEKMEIPINNRLAPINTTRDPYKFAIFYEKKGDPEYDYGLHFYNINGPFYSVQQILDELNNVIFKERGLGQFLLDSNKMINFTWNKATASRFLESKVYFDRRLRNLFTFDYNLVESFIINNVEYAMLNIVKDTSTGSGSGNEIQKTKTYPYFFNMKSIRVYSTLPTIPFKDYDMRLNILSDRNILTEIVFNSMESYDIENLIYIPNVFRHYSMQNQTSLNSVELAFAFKYANGEEYMIYADSLDYASITLCFTPLTKNLEEILE